MKQIKVSSAIFYLIDFDVSGSRFPGSLAIGRTAILYYEIPQLKQSPFAQSQLFLIGILKLY